MNEMVLANRAADWRRLKMLVLDSVSSPMTKRVYNLGLDEFFPVVRQGTAARLYEGYCERLARAPPERRRQAKLPAPPKRKIVAAREEIKL
jgi:hypothetical protein